MTWTFPPVANTQVLAIWMQATEAYDPNGVEYYFECTAGGGNDSGWRDSAFYEDIGLEPLTEYTYRVKARDKSLLKNETGWSIERSCMTPDLDDPLARWMLDDGNGNVARDIVGGYDGTLYGNPQWVVGKIGTGALEFDGVEDCVRTTYTGGPSAYTISLWYNLNETIDTSTFSGQRVLVSKTRVGRSATKWKVGFRTTNGLEFLNETGVGEYARVAYKPAVFNSGEWHHAAVTGTTSQGEIYFDGDLKNTASGNFAAVVWEDPNVFDIARPCHGDSQDFFNGKIDDVRIYDRVLGDAEVAQLYQDGLDN